ncbi:MAG: phage integrase SAM-like domain-containing protein [Saprospiraceae bacterium]|nr:phage integrase SAM-like domain-containing protein [Saprospiraceae bacterium]
MDEDGKLPTLSIIDLRNFISKRSEINPSFFSFTEGLIDQMLQARRIGNARVYKNVLGALKTYRNDNDLRFERNQLPLLKSYEAYFLGQGFHINGLSFNMRTLRSIYNRALKEGIIDQSLYPFRQYRIQKRSHC